MREGAALDWLDDNAERLERLHRETEQALQVVLSVGYLEPGRYERDGGYGSRPWRAAESGAEESA